MLIKLINLSKKKKQLTPQDKDKANKSKSPKYLVLIAVTKKKSLLTQLKRKVKMKKEITKIINEISSTEMKEREVNMIVRTAMTANMIVLIAMIAMTAMVTAMIVKTAMIVTIEEIIEVLNNVKRRNTPLMQIQILESSI